MSATPVRMLIVFVAVAALLSCGIPNIQFIGTPDADSVDISPSPPAASFDHNSNDNSTENFLGYELYYKFYPQTADPLAGAFGADLSAIRAAGSGPSTVEAQGYLRIWAPGEDVPLPPLISVSGSEASTDFAIRLVFPDRPSALLPDPAAAIYLGRTVELIRDPDAWPVLTRRAFDSDDIQIQQSDPDVPADIPPTDSAIHLGIVVLAYGTDFTGSTFVSLYSEPLMLDQPLEIILQ